MAAPLRMLQSMAASLRMLLSHSVSTPLTLPAPQRRKREAHWALVPPSNLQKRAG